MNALQFCVLCSYVLSLISLFKYWRHMVISCVKGRVELNFNLFLSLMKRPISGVKCVGESSGRVAVSHL